MGKKYRQRFGFNSKTYRAGVWAARWESVLVCLLYPSLFIVYTNFATEVPFELTGMYFLYIIPVFLFVFITNYFFLSFYLMPIQWFMSEDDILDKAYNLKIIAVLLMLPTTIFPLGLGLALYRYVALHEQEAVDGPADWALEKARKIAYGKGAL